MAGDSPLTVAGAAVALRAEIARAPRSLLIPFGNHRRRAFRDCGATSRFGHTIGAAATRNTAGCCSAVTEYDGRPWHSGPACGPWGPRTPAAVTQAGYAYCQLRDTQLSVQTRPGHGPQDNGARVI